LQTTNSQEHSDTRTGGRMQRVGELNV